MLCGIIVGALAVAIGAFIGAGLYSAGMKLKD